MMLDDQKRKRLEEYLSSLWKANIHVLSVEELGKKEHSDQKGFGYGKPLKIHFLIEDRPAFAVLETMSANSFGHEHVSDRAQEILWYYSVSNKLPQHVRSIDVGTFFSDGSLLSLRDSEEFFLLTEYVIGTEYAKDLQRISRTMQLEPLDSDRVIALSRYLTEIHKKKIKAPNLYRRRIRELLGHGECIMGLIDNYPEDDPIGNRRTLEMIEEKCLKFRWRMKDRTHRLSQVHGDFHPWNILFQEGTEFTVLDRSRGEWGEPADDVSSMAINYVFQSLQKYSKLDGAFLKLHDLFWSTYLDGTKDQEMLEVVQPFLAWRGLVLANRTWYPNLPDPVRKQIFRLIQNILDATLFDPKDINQYLA